MGLASALSTALTGMSAAETQIDVSGNNLANSQTVGFKSSKTIFANQFLQTLGLGSQPTSDNGGTNPRQIGLGVQVAEITPDFSQGTVEISKSPSDLAIQGDGMFIVEGNTGEQLYSRNGIFKTNANNELVNTNGNRLLGFGVDETFTLKRTELTSLTIPLGSAAVAKATEVATLQGVLSPTGDIADTAEVIQSAVLGDASTARPTASATPITGAPVPDVVTAGTSIAYSNTGPGSHAAGSVYRYKLVFVDNNGKESLPSNELTATVPVGQDTITLNTIPTDSLGEYSQVKIYRTAPGGSSFFHLATTATGGSYLDDNTVGLSATPLDESTINGNYSYLVTFYRAGFEESRPSAVIGPQNIVNGRVLLRNLPTIPGGINPPYTQIRIYRNLATDSSQYRLVDTVAPGTDYTDVTSDAVLATRSAIDLDGPKAGPNTLLTNLLRRDGLTYENLFTTGTLAFEGRKGGRSLESKSFTVTSTSTLQQLVDFMDESMGIRSTADDPQNPIPTSLDTITGSGTLSPGSTITGGKIQFVANNGVDNALSIGLSSFQLTQSAGSVSTPNMGFGSVQTAKGQSAVADFLAYDSLGISINVRVTAVLETRDGTSSTYRWFADSPQNDPSTGTEIGVGTGLVTFDGDGNLISTTNTTVSVERRNVPSQSPLEFDLNFDNVSGLSADKSSLAVARQDGSPPGTLTSFIIGEDGVIRGVFSNGVTRDLGQIRIARFTNYSGLEQRGQNLFAQAVNSGLPIEDDPGQNGTGSIIAGAVELSNTDIGKNLIDLVLASTQYRGNARVITTSQQLLDELLNLRR